MQHILDLYSKFAPRAHHVYVVCMVDIQYLTGEIKQGKKRQKKKKEEDRNHMAKI